MIIPYSRFLERRIERYLQSAGHRFRGETHPAADVLVAADPIPIPGAPSAEAVEPQLSEDPRFM